MKSKALSAALLLFFILLSGGKNGTAAAPEKLKLGEAAPDFSLPRVDTGATVKLSDFRDKKIVIVHFWKSG